MRFNKLSLGFLLVVVFVVSPTASDNAVLGGFTTSLPVLADLTGKLIASSPAAPFLIGGLSLMHVLATMLTGVSDDTAESKLSKLDLQETQKVLMQKLDDVDFHITESTDKIIRELSHTIRSYPLFESLRHNLESFKKDYSFIMPMILDNRRSQMTTDAIKSMMKYDSPFRKDLGAFITTFINPTVNLAASDHTDLFFDFLKEKDHLLALENQDCNQDSLHYKIFKSYIYIAKGLTDAYAMVLSAHVVQYQEELRQHNTLDASGTKAAAEKILDSYKNDMKVLMDKTKWALENSSREVKNCGSFELREGQNYVRLPFVTMVAKIKKYIPFYCAEDPHAPVSLKNYNFVNCSTVEEVIPFKTALEIYHNAKDLERPFSHVKFGITTLGHADGVPASHLAKTSTDRYCAPDFCRGYKNNAVGISLQRVRADPGNVITGVRFRVDNQVIYIDIQQGKFMNDLEVDPRTVHWKKTPENYDTIVMMTNTSSKIEIADHMLEAGNYLTAVQFQATSHGIFKLFYKGAKAPSWFSYDMQGSFANIPKTNEIKINDRDDPAKTASGSKRLISRPADPKKDAYVEFQVTSFKKDLGRTTVPFIDIREVVTNPPSPVAGIGIYHEAAKGDGGLIALKLVQPSLANYVDYKNLEQFAKAEVVA